MSKVLRHKILRNTLALALLLTAAANAPGLLLALGIGDGGPAGAPSAAAPPPAEYDFQYAAAPMGDADPAAWLDAFLKTSSAATSAWSHTWTDFESAPAAGTPSRSPYWQPEGVMFAYAPTFTDIIEPPVGEFVVKGMGYYFADFGPGTPRSGRGPQPQSVEDETPDDPSDVPDNTPPPSSQPDPTPDPTPDPPVSVPEPASMSLFALGLAGIFMFAKRRRHALASSRGARDRG